MYWTPSIVLPLPHQHLFLKFSPQSPPLTIGAASKSTTDKYLQPNIFWPLLFIRVANRNGLQSVWERFLCVRCCCLGVSTFVQWMNIWKWQKTRNNKFSLMVLNNGPEFKKNKKYFRSNFVLGFLFRFYFSSSNIVLFWDHFGILSGGRVKALFHREISWLEKCNLPFF